MGGKTLRTVYLDVMPEGMMICVNQSDGGKLLIIGTKEKPTHGE